VLLRDGYVVSIEGINRLAEFVQGRQPPGCLALTAGFDRSFLSDLESGRHSCMVDRVFDLAAALGVDASSLLDESLLTD
jgi:hypothetical protein